MRIARRGFLKLLGAGAVAAPSALSKLQQTLVSGYANGPGIGAAVTQKAGHVTEQIEEGYLGSGYAIEHIVSRTGASPTTITSAERFIPEIWANAAMNAAQMNVVLPQLLRQGDRLNIPRIANLTAGAASTTISR